MVRKDFDDKSVYNMFRTVLESPDTIVIKEELKNKNGLGKSKEYNYRAISLKDGSELLRMEQRQGALAEGWTDAKTFCLYSMNHRVYGGIVIDSINNMGQQETRTSLPEDIEKIIIMFQKYANNGLMCPERFIAMTLLQEKLKQKHL